MAMNAKYKKMIISVLVLCIIATCSGLLLGFVNKITYVDPLKESLNKFKELSETDGEFELISKYEGDIAFFAKSNDEIPVYAVVGKAVSSYGGEIEMYAFIKENKIYKIVQGKNNETFFSDVEKANFYDKFYNKDLTTQADFSTDKADLVAGATKTSTAVTDAINTIKNYYTDYIKENGAGLTNVEADLSSYNLVKKVQKDSDGNYYFTSEFQTVIHQVTVKIKYLICISNELKVKSVEDLSKHGGQSYAPKTDYINKTEAEVNDTQITSTGATTSENILKDTIIESFDILSKMQEDK